MRQMSSRGWIAKVVARAASAVLLSLVLIAVTDAAPTLAAEAPKVEEQWVTHVTATAATLQAKVNPGEVATTYKFEYATSEAALLAGEGEVFPASPAPEGEVGAGAEGVIVQEHPQSLTPHTTYYYRVLATNGEGKTPGCLTPGSCQSFTTRVAGGEFTLPDGRAWELISPPPGDNGVSGAAGIIEGGDGPLIQAAENGDAISYGINGSSEANPAGASNFSQVLSVRDGGGGWSSQDIATPHEQSTGVSIGHGQEYKFFSPNLSVGLVAPFGTGYSGQEAAGATPLSPCASEKTIYLRADAPLTSELPEHGVYGEAVAEGGYKPLVTSTPGCANVPSATVFGEQIAFEGASPDLSHVVIHSGVPLAEMTPEGNPAKAGLYEWSGGRLQAISVLPAPSGEQVAGYLGNGADARGAVSSNGSRIFWSESETNEPHLYMRDVATGQSVQMDKEEPDAAGGATSAQFQFANSSGSKMFFTDEAALTANSGAASSRPDLYECEISEEVAGSPSCTLIDLTAVPGVHASVRGVVLGGSNDSTHVYFVARGVLTSVPNQKGENATARDDNLYMMHYNQEEKTWEEPVFVAVLSAADRQDWEGEHGNLESLASRVSPNGEYLEFMSEQGLTGYDNRDANSGEPDEEVYLYRAPSAGAPVGGLVCASCNPTGARPDGLLDPGNELLIDGDGVWGGRWLAASVPGWTAMSLNTARYQSRYLSDEGRLFFDSPDALVPQATNGLTDVYEYEPVGVGGEDGCKTSSSTFSERSEGCVGLVSSGSSAEESAFVDASASGEDVFFVSSARLASGDNGGALAVYDAHVCSVTAPCSTEAASPPPCGTEASCRQAPTPQPVIFGSGPSETFSGAGNPVSAPVPVVKQKAKPPTRVQKLAKMLVVCRKRFRGVKRVGCEKQARHRYGALKARKSANTDRRAK